MNLKIKYEEKYAEGKLEEARFVLMYTQGSYGSVMFLDHAEMKELKKYINGRSDL